MDTPYPIPRGMFKFRKTLVNQLWSYVQCPFENEDQQSLNEQAVIGGDESRPLHLRRSSSSTASLPDGKKRQLHNMLMRLKKCKLEVLLEAISSEGAAPGGCVLMPAASTTSGLPAHLLLAQVFRWPDLHHESELRRVSFCEFYQTVSEQTDKNFEDKTSSMVASSLRLRPISRLYECCNPFHWSRLQKQRK